MSIMTLRVSAVLDSEVKVGNFQTIYQAQGKVFYQDIQTPRSGLKNEAQTSFFFTHIGGWIPDETLFGVLDIVLKLII